jgi:outer membrane lipoprotein LolB
VLSACVALQPTTSLPRSPPVAGAFEIDGRVLVRRGETRHHVNISWRHAATSDQILLTTPFGQGVAELSRDTSGARLVMADHREFVAADWVGLAEQLFGIRLPLDDLPVWVTGQSTAAASAWQVEYLDYQSNAPDALPTLLELKHDDIEIRLKIDEWNRGR